MASGTSPTLKRRYMWATSIGPIWPYGDRLPTADPGMGIQVEGSAGLPVSSPKRNQVLPSLKLMSSPLPSAGQSSRSLFTSAAGPVRKKRTLLRISGLPDRAAEERRKTSIGAVTILGLASPSTRSSSVHSLVVLSNP